MNKRLKLRSGDLKRVALCVETRLDEGDTSDVEELENAFLVREAIDIRDEIGLTPRQLAEQRDKLIATIHTMQGMLELASDAMNDDDRGNRVKQWCEKIKNMPNELFSSIGMNL